MQDKRFKILPQMREKGEEKEPQESFHLRIVLKDCKETSKHQDLILRNHRTMEKRDALHLIAHIDK